MNNKETLKNKLAKELIFGGKEDFPGEQDIAINILNSKLDDVKVWIYSIAVKKFLEKRKFKQALKWLDYALVFGEDYYQAYFRKGEVFKFLNNYKKAVKYYTKGINIYNKDQTKNKSEYDLAWGCIERAICHIRLNEYREANRDLTVGKSEMKATNTDSSARFTCNEISSLVTLSFLAQADKIIAEKLQEIINKKERLNRLIFERAQAIIQGRPLDDEELNRLIYELNKAYKEAIDGNYYEDDNSLKIMSDKKINDLNFKGYSVGESGKYQESINIFEKVLNLDPENIYALKNIGVCFRELGKYQESIDIFEEVLNLDPQNEDAISSLEKLEIIKEYNNAWLKIYNNFPENNFPVKYNNFKGREDNDFILCTLMDLNMEEINLTSWLKKILPDNEKSNKFIACIADWVEE